MTGDLISFLKHGGGDLVEIVNDAKAAVTVYKFAASAGAHLRGFIGPKQQENLHKIGEAAREKLTGVDLGRLSEPSPSVLTPLHEAACQENREELQELWACLLANAMADKGKRVRGDFIGFLAQFDPQDALALKIVGNIQGADHTTDAVREQLNKLNLPTDD